MEGYRPNEVRKGHAELHVEEGLELPDGRFDRFREGIDALNHVPGAFQSHYPELRMEVMMSMQHSAWTGKLAEWPQVDTIHRKERHISRDLTKFSLVLQMLEEPGQASAFYAPTRWVPAEGVSRSKFFRQQAEECLVAQLEVLDTYTPQQKVPSFDIRKAAGNPGHWNFLQPTTWKDIKKQAYTPPSTDSVPDRAKLLEFLSDESRKDSKGRTIRSRLNDPIEHEDGWLEFPIKDFDESLLPKRTRGP